MKNNHFKDAVFKQYREKILLISEHYDGCKYENRDIPISACQCDCFCKQIFNLGRDAEKDLFQK